LPRPQLPPGTTLRVPGEFEPQTALLLGCHKMVWDDPQLFGDLVAAARSHAEVVALVCNVHEYRLAQRLLSDRKIPTERVHFAELPHDTMWTRDYGPVIAQRHDGQPVVLNADYSLHARPADDALPKRLAESFKIRTSEVPLKIDGGNLLSNGRGLCIATHDLLYANLDAGQDEKQVRELLRTHYGAVQMVFLEPLAGEPTGHVDMFATFTSPDTVVVGAYDPADDPANAAILDRNAARLAQVQLGRQKLRVVRIPMPPNGDKIWRSYTNVVYLNHALLLPSYPSLNRAGEAEALAVYRQLLPGWKLVPIQADNVNRLGGALHCVTMNLGVIQKLPKFPPPQQVDDHAEQVLAATDDALSLPLPTRSVSEANRLKVQLD